MITLPAYPRSAYLTHGGYVRRHPLYTIGDLVLDLRRYAPAQVLLWTADRIVEITSEMVVEIALSRTDGTPGCHEPTEYELARTSPLLLTVPHEGVAVACRNPGVRLWRRSA